jgi:hypothetical protein
LRLAVVALLLGAGCVYVAPAARFRSVETKPMDDARVVDDFDAHDSDFAFGQVAVVESDDNQNLEIADGTLKGYQGQQVEVIGTFELKREFHGPFYPSDYLWLPRKIMCWPQVPLMFVTVGLWLILPFPYACFGKTPGDRAHWIDWVKQIVDSAGGNLGVVTFAKKKDQIEGATGYVVKVSGPQ